MKQLTKAQLEKIKKLNRKHIRKSLKLGFLYGLGMILSDIVFIFLRANYIQDDDFLRAGSLVSTLVIFIGLSSKMRDLRDIFHRDMKKILSDKE